MSIVENRKASHDYFIEERYEAGLALEGWEVKAIRAGRAQIADGYVMVRNGELVLIGAHVSPLPSVSTQKDALPGALGMPSDTTVPPATCCRCTRLSLMNEPLVEFVSVYHHFPFSSDSCPCRVETRKSTVWS